MGTGREWLMVAFYCVFWGGWMLAWETPKRIAANLKPALLPASVLIWILSGLTFGLLMTFKLQASHSPLVFITVASFACAILVTRLTRRERSKAFNQWHSWMGKSGYFLMMATAMLLLIHRAIPVACLLGVAGGVLYWLDYSQPKAREPQAFVK
jgi:FtsH-binding integral membrane protein